MAIDRCFAAIVIKRGKVAAPVPARAAVDAIKSLTDSFFKDGFLGLAMHAQGYVCVKSDYES